MTQRPNDPETLRLKIALLGVALLLLGYGGYQWHRKADKSSAPPPAIHPRVSQSKFTVKGMTYTSSYKGKPLLVMKVNFVEFGKKKIGFFRVGGVRQLELRGVKIDYHEPLGEGSGDFSSTEDPRDISSVVKTAAQSFTDRVGRLVGFQIRRLKLHYHHKDGTQTDIEGDMLELQQNDESLRIRGNVHVRHAGRILGSDEIYFQPHDKTFFTRKHYTLTANGESQMGEGIRTDLFLNPLPEKTTKEDREEVSKNLSNGDSKAEYYVNQPDLNR